MTTNYKYPLAISGEVEELSYLCTADYNQCTII